MYTNAQSDRHTDRQTVRKTYRQSMRHSNRQTGTETETDRQIDKVCIIANFCNKKKIAKNIVQQKFYSFSRLNLLRVLMIYALQLYTLHFWIYLWNISTDFRVFNYFFSFQMNIFGKSFGIFDNNSVSNSVKDLFKHKNWRIICSLSTILKSIIILIETRYKFEQNCVSFKKIDLKNEMR